MYIVNNPCAVIYYVNTLWNEHEHVLEMKIFTKQNQTCNYYLQIGTVNQNNCN